MDKVLKEFQGGVAVGTQKTNRKDEVLLSVQDLKVWFELRRFGFGISG